MAAHPVDSPGISKKKELASWQSLFVERVFGCFWWDLVGSPSYSRLLEPGVLPLFSPDGLGIGHRGLCFVRLNSAGEVAYVRDLGEPLFKAGELTEKLLEALTKDQKPPERPAMTGPPQTPKTAGAIVRCVTRPKRERLFWRLQPFCGILFRVSNVLFSSLMMLVIHI